MTFILGSKETYAVPSNISNGIVIVELSKIQLAS